MSLMTLGGAPITTVETGAASYYPVSDPTGYWIKHSVSTVSTFKVTAGSTGVSLGIGNEPKIGVAGQALMPQPYVEMKDNGGQVITGVGGYVRAKLLESKLVQEIADQVVSRFRSGHQLAATVSLSCERCLFWSPCNLSQIAEIAAIVPICQMHLSAGI